MTIPSCKSIETYLSGLPISEGVAGGKVCLLDNERHSWLPNYKVTEGGTDGERVRLEGAIAVAVSQIETLVCDVRERLGPAEAEIFRVQKVILEEPRIRLEMMEVVQTDGVCAEVAVARTLNACEKRFRGLANEYIKERATDIGEARRRLLDALRDTNPALRCAREGHCQRGRDRIIIAEELTPGLAVELDAEHTIGFITERGGPTSHAAILARALGIPAVSGIENIHTLVLCGTSVLLNGDTGEVIVWPTKESLGRYALSARRAGSKPTVVEPVAGLEVMANISLSSEAAEAAEMKAEGIGIYRTEFELLAAGRMLNEQEQFERYAFVVKSMNGHPVTVRLLDIGGDKDLPFLGLHTESNPQLGLRGARLLLARPELLIAQARALARASAYGQVHVLYPMIVDREQFLALKRIFVQSIADLPAGNLKHGVMFEVPSACLLAEEILEAADFASIGTNDLLQYLYAVDRDNELVACDYDPGKPALWSLIRELVRAADKTGRPLAVCGEAAADPTLLQRFTEAGIRSVSVNTRLIPRVRLTAGSHKGGGVGS
ncbi:MAG: phosphoenolpyruvate--protein phosphotransferase [Planctomycetota bacterium]